MKNSYLKAHHVEPIQVTEQAFEMTIIGRNSKGTKTAVRVEMNRDLFAWFVKERCREACKTYAAKLMGVASRFLGLFANDWSKELDHYESVTHTGNTTIMTYDPKDFK